MHPTIEALANRFSQLNISFASIALIYYDYALTFPMEIQYIWGQKFRLSTLLYICCRYALVANILYTLFVTHKFQDSCDTWYKIVAGFSVVGRIAVIFTMSAKTFAIFGRNRSILAYFVLVGTVCIVADIIFISGRRCQGPDPIPRPFVLISMVMIEYAAAFLVFFRSFQAYQLSGTQQFKKKNKGLLRLMLEHGALYFFFVTLLRTVQVILYFTNPARNFFMRHLFNALTLPLSCLFTARFLLHLRAWEHKRTAGSSSSDPRSNLPFTVTTSGPSARVTLTSILSLDDFGEDPVREGVHGDEEEDEQEEDDVSPLHDSTRAG